MTIFKRWSPEVREYRKIERQNFISFYNKHIRGVDSQFKRQFPSLGETTDKYITLLVQIKENFTTIVKKENKITKAISYILQFLNSARFVPNDFERI